MSKTAKLSSVGFLILAIAVVILLFKKPSSNHVSVSQPGPRGKTGQIGPAGPKGKDGLAGLRGSSVNGINGSSGKNGANGTQGPQGPSGNASCPNGDCVSLQVSSPGVQEIGSINISGTLIAGNLQGSGSGLTNINATQLNGQ